MPAETSKVQAAVRTQLESGDLTTLFLNTLGWDAPATPSEYREGAAIARVIAEKRGVYVWVVDDADADSLERLDRNLARASHERLLVSRGPGGLVWQWPEKRRSGFVRRSRLSQRHPGELTDVVQRLSSLRFEPGDTNELTVLDVRDRVRRSFNTEQVTDAFYREFNACHELIGGSMAAAGLLEGIASPADRKWYASVLLNRLMFLYFIEKKGFLDNDPDYLRNRLRRLREHTSVVATGYEFFESFLLPLFHDAIGAGSTAALQPLVRDLIGDVPYLDGGVFARHPLEERYVIRLPDHAFDRVFAVFERYRWHLDDREAATGNEINPDILGHIFERYVNRKDTGSFYTPNDTTGWMASRTVGLVLLRKLVDLGLDLAAVTSANPRRYIPADVFFGEQDFTERTLPAAASEAQLWALPSTHSAALPSETTWEVYDRLRHGEELDVELAAGGVKDPEDAIARNLDVVSIVIDGLRRLPPPELDAFWRLLTSLSVLDPTCGSGAFLLAALAVLEEIAEAVIARAAELADIQRTDIHEEFSALPPVARPLHIRQRLVLDCLYGADIAQEAIEIARLRLYLALVAVMSDRRALRPLPDLEFNLVAGNLLVGINSDTEMSNTLGSAVWGHAELPAAARQLELLADSIRAFRSSQRHGTIEATAAAKARARAMADDLKRILDHALHKAVGTGTEFDSWVHQHSPLHYVAAFPGVMLQGGFDVVIGNPPYLKRSAALRLYKFAGPATAECPDIFAPCTERAFALKADGGAFAMVLLYAAVWSGDYAALRRVLTERDGWVAAASFAKRPDALFRGVQVRNSILFQWPGTRPRVLGTALHHWAVDFRPALFSTLRLADVPGAVERPTGRWPRLGNSFSVDLWVALSETASQVASATGATAPLWVKRVAGYWYPVAHRSLRTYDESGRLVPTNQSMIMLRDMEMRDAVFAVLASRLGLVLWQAVGDDINVPPWNTLELPIVFQSAAPAAHEELARVGRAVAAALESDPQSVLWNKNAGLWTEALDTRTVTATSDEAVAIVLRILGLQSRWGEFEAAYWRLMRATGQATGSVRGLSPPVAIG